MAQKIKNSFVSILLQLRWPNLLIALLSLLISYFLILIPINQEVGFDIHLTFPDFILLSFSTLLIMAGGYIINDLMDVESDLANQKNHSIKWIPRKMILTWYSTFSLTGLSLALWMCFRLNMLPFWSIFLAAFGLLLIYSTNLKSTPLAGNMLIAILCGLIPLLPLIFDQGMNAFQIESNYVILYFLGFFGLLVTLIRELVKDMEDEVGDRQTNLATFPVVFGMEAARWTCFMFFIFFLVMMMAMLYLMSGQDLVSVYYLMLLVMCPMLFLSYRITVIQTKKDFHQLSTHLKYVMISGMAYGIVYSFTAI